MEKNWSVWWLFVLVSSFISWLSWITISFPPTSQVSTSSKQAHENCQLTVREGFSSCKRLWQISGGGILIPIFLALCRLAKEPGMRLSQGCSSLQQEWSPKLRHCLLALFGHTSMLLWPHDPCLLSRKMLPSHRRIGWKTSRPCNGLSQCLDHKASGAGLLCYVFDWDVAVGLSASLKLIFGLACHGRLFLTWPVWDLIMFSHISVYQTFFWLEARNQGDGCSGQIPCLAWMNPMSPACLNRGTALTRTISKLNYCWSARKIFSSARVSYSLLSIICWTLYCSARLLP